jgi:zinc transporter 1/2/3
MNVNLFKLLTSIGLWLIAVACGLLPLHLRNFSTNKLAISLSQCFAGGLFLAICLIHVLPEARENLEDSWKEEDHEVFPLSYFICLLTFSAILLIDKVLFNNTDIIEGGERPSDLRASLIRKSILGHKDADPEENFQEMVSHNMKIALSMSQMNIQAQENDEEEYLEIPNEQLPENLQRSNSNESPKLNPVNRIGDPNQLNNGVEVKHDHKHGHGHGHGHKNDHKHDHGHGHGHGHHGHHHATVKKGASYTGAMVLLAAMGIHSLFEGLAYGVLKEEGEVFNMFMAIAAHKWCDALVVGLSFVAAELPIRMATFLSLFLSLFTPLGIFIGYLGSENDLVTGIFLALSAGTFLYIACAEIIIEEFAIADHKFWKFLMYTIGIVFITITTYMFHDHHHHDH